MTDKKKFEEGKMKRYAIKVEETLKRTIIVNANDIDTALQFVENAVDREEIILDIDDFDRREISLSEYFSDGEIPDDEDVSHFYHLEIELFPLEFVGIDHCSRPVYKNGETLFVDVEPRKNKKPVICTVLNNVFGGEPDTPINRLSKYQHIEPIFISGRITW